MSRKLSARPCTAGSSHEVAADALDDVALRAALDAQFHRPDRAGRGGGDLGEELRSRSPSSPRPQLGQVLAGDVLGLETQGALRGRRDEAQHAVGIDDHDDVGGVGDQRGVAILDDARRLALAHQRVAAQHHALAHHQQQRQGEHDHGHDRRRAADVPAAEVDQHQEGGQHRRVRQRARQRVRGVDMARAGPARGCAAVRAPAAAIGAYQHR